MKPSTPWLGLILLGIVLIASPASAQDLGNIWDDVRQLFVGFGNLLYTIAVVGIIAGGTWSAWKWHQTREFGEGLGGMAVIAVMAVFIFFVIPKLTAVRPTMSEVIAVVRYVIG
jgi:hypothetical protein